MVSWCPLWEKVSPRAHLHPCPKSSCGPSPVMAATQKTASWDPQEANEDRGFQGRTQCPRGKPGATGTQNVLGWTVSPKFKSTWNSESDLIWK